MKPIWHLFYKEWIKTRTAFFCSLLVGVGVMFYIFIGVENKITLMGAKNYTLNILYSNPPVIYYSLLRYLPLLAAVCIGISQYVPEVAQRRIRLTLHLPVGNRTLFRRYGFLWIAAHHDFQCDRPRIFLLEKQFHFSGRSYRTGTSYRMGLVPRRILGLQLYRFHGIGTQPPAPIVLCADRCRRTLALSLRCALSRGLRLVDARPCAAGVAFLPPYSVQRIPIK